MFRSIIKLVLRQILGLVFRVRVQGIDPNMRSDRLLIVANHQSLIDGLLLGLFLPYNPLFVVHSTVVKRFWFRAVLSLADYVTVDTQSPLAIKHIIKTIRQGRPIVIFPEGRVTTTGSLMKIYDGPAFVAARTGATILPVRIDGAVLSYFSYLGDGHPRKLFPRITLTALPTTTIAMSEGGTARDRRQRAGEVMRRLMQEMQFAARPAQTLFDALLAARRIYGGRRRLLDDVNHSAMNYNKLINAALILGRLAQRHTLMNENVGVLLPNAAPTVALVFGLNAFGRVPAMLNFSAGRDALRSACVCAGIRTVVTSRAFIAAAKLDEKISGLNNVEWLYLEDLRSGLRLSDKLWFALFARWFPKAARMRRTAEDPAAVLFTSGSEGTPKGVVLSQRAILANVMQLRSVVDIAPTDCFLSALPLFHSFGLTAGGILPVLAGSEAFLYPSPLHYKVIPELAYDRSCTIMLGTSTFLGNYARFAHPYDFYRLRYVVSGAEKLSAQVKDLWFEKFGIRIFEGYGATETAPVLALNTPMAFRSNTVGQLLPGIQARLTSVPGVTCGGVLHVSGPNLMSGYLRVDCPCELEPPSSEIGEGWYNTGDVVEIDADGFVHVIGRVKRFAKIAGEMVSLEVVEKMARTASPTHDHAAISIPDPGRGEMIILFTTDPTLARSQLQGLGASELSVPRRLMVIKALPLLGNGKTDYVSLRALAS